MSKYVPGKKIGQVDFHKAEKKTTFGDVMIGIGVIVLFFAIIGNL